MIYDTIVIGGGASGLFYSASDSAPGNKLILEKGKHFGQKLLLSAQGQCNITHAGSIKDFIDFYGDKGKTIRSILYKHSNLELMEFIESRGLKLQTRAGGKVFPRSMSAKDVLKVLLDATKENGYEMKTLCQVSSIDPESKTVIVESQGNEYTYSYKKLIIATGGATYPMTGSDGNFADVLCKDLGVDNIDFRPALVPLKVDKYPYGELTGVSIDKALCSIGKNQVQGPLLFTHKDLSGPSILHVSRYANDDDKLYINYLPDYNVESLRQLFMSAKNEEPKLYLWKFLHREFNLPTSFCKLFAKRFNLGESEFSAITKSDINELCQHLCHDEFTLKPFTAKDFNKAMVSAGGVNLKEIDLKDMSLKKWPDIHVIGEALDVDGDTGGYNLQFAWSSARMAQ